MAGNQSTAAAAAVAKPTLALLKRTDGSGGIPAFNQGLYSDSSCNIPPPYDKATAKDNSQYQRNIQTSGCGLCAWVSYLAAAGCVAPHYDSDTYTLRTPQDSEWTTITPGTFLQYLMNYIGSQAKGDPTQTTTLIQSIFAPDPKGALTASSSDLIAAVNELVALSALNSKYTFNQGDPLYTFAYSRSTMPGNSSNVFSPGTHTEVGSSLGSDIAGVTACIDGGYPAVLGVHFKGSASASNHQVLAVGYVKSGGKTYYVLDDSGFGPMSPYGDLGSMVAPVNVPLVLAHTPSPGTMHTGSSTEEYDKITWYQPLKGLEQATKLQPVYVPPRPAAATSSGAAQPASK